MTAIGAPSTAYLVTSNTDDEGNTTYATASEATTVDYTAENDSLYTVYIKVTNPKDGINPVITIDGTEYVSHATAFTHTNGIYVYQFININPIGATVTYTGASNSGDVTVASE